MVPPGSLLQRSLARRPGTPAEGGRHGSRRAGRALSLLAPLAALLSSTPCGSGRGPVVLRLGTSAPGLAWAPAGGPAAPSSAPPPQDDGSASELYQGVRWSKATWMWEVHVQDLAAPRWLPCGSYETEVEAAKAHDCAQLALDQEFPDQRAEAWRRNLPRETIYQDEVDVLKGLLSEARRRDAA
mmetsp:Transcript_84526/g.273758  ORF Transcript_84526/g.273758 Transcript_84526/m.273758 type:complete len:184 (+) Transcript_84526:1-552(+)